MDVPKECGALDVETASLLIDIESIVRRLKNYGVTSLPQVSIQLALEEARRILAGINQKSYGEADIKARTELSYARQSFNMVKEILFGQNKIQDQKQALEIVENKVNDLLKFLNDAMDQTRDGILANQYHHDIFVRSQNNCENIQKIKNDCQERTSVAKNLLHNAKEHNSKAAQVFERIGIIFEKLGNLGQELATTENGLSEVVKDYRIRFVEPCQKHSRELLNIANSLLGTLGSDLGMNAEQTLRAANAYHKIMKTILDASKVADETMLLTKKLLDRVKSKNHDGYDLYAQTDEARVKSRDLRQEAEGLRWISDRNRNQNKQAIFMK